MLERPHVTRLAPSPTGALHLGNLRTFLINWALARRHGWRIVMRVEDLDGPRVRPGAAREALDILEWVGMDWDGEALVQSRDLAPYREAMRELAARGACYPCAMTLGDIARALSAPNEGEHEQRFPAELRPPVAPRAFDDERTGWRLVVGEGAVEFDDLFAGPQRHDPSSTVGDFVIWAARGQPAYQLAVVVDDHRQGVTMIVRGDDLLGSAARQILVRRALGLGPDPAQLHLPLVRGEDGRRLAKRHGDTRVAHYRERGVPAQRLVGLMAAWTGLLGANEPRGPMDAREFAQRLDLDRIPRQDVVFGAADDRWLMEGAR